MKKPLFFISLAIMLIGILLLIIALTANTGVQCADGHRFGEWVRCVTTDCQVKFKRDCSSCGEEQYTQSLQPHTIPFAQPAITADVGEIVMLGLYSVHFDDSTVIPAEQIVWSSETLHITDGYVAPTTEGVYPLTAKAGDAIKTIYLLVKNPSDTEYVLYANDFDEESLDGYRVIEASHGAQHYVADGKLILDACSHRDSYLRILLPEWIGDFGDYEIVTSFTMTRVQTNTMWFAIMARVQNEDYPYWQFAVRSDATASNGVEIANCTKASGVKGGWTVTHAAAFTESISPSSYYTQSWELEENTGRCAINGTTLLESDSLTYTPGAVGFQVRGATAAVDRIKIVIPAESETHIWSDWASSEPTPCSEDRTETRKCIKCNALETRQVAAGHNLVQHAQKMHTCVESGWLAYESCTRCNYTTRVDAAPTGHSFERTVRGIAHRGYSISAPENTLEAYRLAKEMGFVYAECDVAYTADGIPVIIHDDTMDRTSNGTGKISEFTYAQLLQYDFGSWKGEAYAGTKIPTFEAFIELCAEIGLHPYIELKSRGGACTQEMVQQLADIVARYGMTENSTWVSYSPVFLAYVKNVCPTARLGYVNDSDATPDVIAAAQQLRTGSNEVFLAINYMCLTDAGVLRAAINMFDIEVYTINSESTILSLPAYVSGVTSNSLNAQEIIVNASKESHACIVCNTKQKD